MNTEALQSRMEYVIVQGHGRCAVPFPGRPLTADEESYLRQSVAELGIVNPIVLYASKTWGTALIQGRNRHRLAGELGIKVPVNHLGPMADDAANKLAQDIQAAGRQLTPAEVERARRQRNERMVAARDEGHSFRSIADEENISERQARRIIEEQSNTRSGAAPTPHLSQSQNDDEPEEEIEEDDADDEDDTDDGPTFTRGRDGKTYRQPPPAKLTPEQVRDQTARKHRDDALRALKQLTKCVEVLLSTSKWGDDLEREADRRKLTLTGNGSMLTKLQTALERIG